MASKYNDIPSIVQVIGNIYNNPSLLDNEEYFFCEEDFTEKFHRILFEAIYNLHALGVEKININVIEDYLEQRPEKFAIYKTNNGQEYLQKISINTQFTTFNYYYHRMKKMTLFRAYQDLGLDLSWLYDINNILDIKKKQAQEEWLDNTPIEEIAELIDNKILDIRCKYVDNIGESASMAGDDALELLERLKDNPEFGYPLYGPIINTITRGARLKKFYLRSAATGSGKTRAMIADACNFACDEIYDSYKRKWVSNNTKEPTLFISTEQEKDELQTMMIAFLADVDEEHIIEGKYYVDEWDRVCHAAKILKESPLYIELLPDFSMQDIENCIKKNIREFDVKYICLDYIHSSTKILGEITSQTGIKGLREDNVLFMISIKLKDICNKYGVFIMSATQLNGMYTSAQQFDQNLLRGAKSIADKIDSGMIILDVSEEDREILKDICANNSFEMPTKKISIYKNRRGKYKGILLWCRANLGTCRIEPIFVTNYQYQLISIDDITIEVKQ